MGTRFIRCLLVATFLAIGSSSLAYGQTGLSYTISPTSGPVGTTITFDGTGCPQEKDPTVTRAEVRFEVFATVGAGVSQGSFIAFAAAQSNPDDSFSGATTIPANAQPGVHQTQVVCANGVTVQGATFEVTVAQTTTSSTSTTVAPTPTTSSTTVAPTTSTPTTTPTPTTATTVATTPTSSNTTTPTTAASTTTTSSSSTTSTTVQNTAASYTTQSTGLARTGPSVNLVLLVGIALTLIGVGAKLCGPKEIGEALASHTARCAATAKYLFSPTRD